MKNVKINYRNLLFYRKEKIMKSKRILAAVISAAMIPAMSSCGKNDNEQVPDTALTEDGKKIVKMYADLNLYDNLYSQIAEFNNKSPEYEVQLTEYCKEFEEPLTRLNTDITTGNPPDILILDAALPLKSYNDKGLFADLYEFIDSDPDMKREDLIGSVLKAGEADGKLFKISFDFYIDTVVGKTSLVGEKQGRTAEEFFELAESYPDKRAMPADMTKYRALLMFAYYGCNAYADESTGKCSFNGDGFIKLLEFCDTFPSEFEGNRQDFDDEFADAVHNGTILFTSDHPIVRFNSIRLLEQGLFGEPVTFMGFPNVDGNGSVICPSSNEYAVMSASQNKEGAWEFLKYFLSEEYQNEIALEQQSFPIRRSSLEFAAEAAKKGVYDKILEEYYEPKIVFSGNIIGVGLNTDEDNRKICGLIDSAVGYSQYTSHFYDIISGEAAMYFAGQRPAKETAEIIQNRVQNYIDENG